MALSIWRQSFGTKAKENRNSDVLKNHTIIFLTSVSQFDILKSDCFDDFFSELEGSPWLGSDDLVKAAETGSGAASAEAARLADLGARSVRRCFEARRTLRGDDPIPL